MNVSNRMCKNIKISSLKTKNYMQRWLYINKIVKFLIIPSLQQINDISSNKKISRTYTFQLLKLIYKFLHATQMHASCTKYY